MRRILVCGATSGIVMESLKHFATDGDALYLVGRSEEKLEAVRGDLAARGASKVHTSVCDLSDSDSHSGLFDAALSALGGLDVLYIGYGTLGNNDECKKNFKAAEKELQSNFTSAVSILTIAANYFEEKKDGTIAVITSVAGDRGRKSNYIYGSAKGALSLFLQGLRNRLYESGVSVVTIKPGFVDTPMTAGMKKGLLFAKASTVGAGVYRAIVRKRDIVYLPWFWRYIMLIIRHIPERMFKRMSI